MSFGTFELGLDLLDERREVEQRISQVDSDDEDAGLPPYADFEQARNRIDERRVDPYVMLGGAHGMLEWETGLRYETTETDIAADDESFDNDYATP